MYSNVISIVDGFTKAIFASAPADPNAIHCTGCGDGKDECSCWCAGCERPIAPGDACSTCVCVECGRHKSAFDHAYAKDRKLKSSSPCIGCIEDRIAARRQRPDYGND